MAKWTKLDLHSEVVKRTNMFSLGNSPLYFFMQKKKNLEYIICHNGALPPISNFDQVYGLFRKAFKPNLIIISLLRTKNGWEQPTKTLLLMNNFSYILSKFWLYCLQHTLNLQQPDGTLYIVLIFRVWKFSLIKFNMDSFNITPQCLRVIHLCISKSSKTI